MGLRVGAHLVEDPDDLRAEERQADGHGADPSAGHPADLHADEVDDDERDRAEHGHDQGSPPLPLGGVGLLGLLAHGQGGQLALFLLGEVEADDLGLQPLDLRAVGLDLGLELADARLPGARGGLGGRALGLLRARGGLSLALPGLGDGLLGPEAIELRVELLVDAALQFGARRFRRFGPFQGLGQNLTHDSTSWLF